MLNSDVQKAKAALAKHVTGIRMVPESDGGKGHYMAEGDWNLLGGYGEGEEKCVRMVAGGCNAPNALRLPFRLHLST